MDEMTLTLNSPITEKQWDIIEDVDFENTDRIWFHTKNGKDVEFIKRKKGKWNRISGRLGNEVECSNCHDVFWIWMHNYSYCPRCGADMRGESDE